MPGVEGRCAVVTGAGGGLGRSHALFLAAHGASVVVNDLGAALDGSVDDLGTRRISADAVVSEIIAAGGNAVASHDDVATEEGAAAARSDARSTPSGRSTSSSTTPASSATAHSRR